MIKTLKKDLLRRDFTINTICMNSKGEIIDTLNIMEDLNRKASFKNSNKLINNKLEQEIISEYVENGGKITWLV